MYAPPLCVNVHLNSLLVWAVLQSRGLSTTFNILLLFALSLLYSLGPLTVCTTQRQSLLNSACLLCLLRNIHQGQRSSLSTGLSTKPWAITAHRSSPLAGMVLPPLDTSAQAPVRPEHITTLGRWREAELTLSQTSGFAAATPPAGSRSEVKWTWWGGAPLPGPCSHLRLPCLCGAGQWATQILPRSWCYWTSATPHRPRPGSTE